MPAHLHPVLHLHPHHMTVGAEGVTPFYWPVAMNSLLAARDAYVTSVMDFVRREGIEKSPAVEALWLALPHLASDFCYIFQVATAAQRIGESQWQPDGGEVAEIAAGGHPTPTPLIQQLPTLPVAAPGWRRVLRVGKSLFSTGAVVTKLPYAIDPANDVLTFSVFPALLNQARSEGVRRLVIGRFDDWFLPGAKTDDSRQPDLTASVATTYREIVAQAFRAGGSEADDNTLTNLSETANRVVKRIYSQMEQLNGKAKWLPKQFWCGTCGHPLNRLFGHAVRKAGGTVTSFDHGMGSGMWDSWAQTLLEFNWSDRFVTFSAAMIEGLRRNYAPQLMGHPGRNCEFVVSACPAITTMRGSAPDKQAGKRLLYVPTLYAGRSASLLPLLPDLVAVDWQARMLSFLHAAGWQVRVKPHPDSYCAPPPSFTQFGVEIVDGRFELLADGNEPLLFDYPQTTAFRTALTSRRPIVVIDLPRLSLQAAARAAIARRCAIVRGWFDAENRVQIDWNELQEALARAPGLAADTSFREEFFPAGGASD